jgi:hypothetical protein
MKISMAAIEILHGTIMLVAIAPRTYLDAKG